MIPKKEFSTGTRTMQQAMEQYPPKAKYVPKPVTPKTVKTVDATNENKIPMRP